MKFTMNMELYGALGHCDVFHILKKDIMMQSRSPGL